MTTWNIFTRDIVAVLIVAGGGFVFFYNLYLYLCRRVFYRWMFLVSATSGLGFVVMFGLSLLRAYGGGDIVAPMIGRPVIIIAVLALSLWTMLISKLTEDQNDIR